MKKKTSRRTKKANKIPRESKFIPQENLDKIGEIAIYYGFIPQKSINITKADTDLAKEFHQGDTIDDETDKHERLQLHAEEKIALIRTYIEQNMQSWPQPVMLYFKDSCHSKNKNSHHRYADLEILGASGSIAEATLIQTARAMLNEEGYNDTIVEINSLGDHDSAQRFLRELNNYYRKHLAELTPECRQILKNDPLELLSSHIESCKTINDAAPKSMDFLCESSRRHLEELLDYMETLNIPYTINNSLIANRRYCNETIFTIVNNAPDAAKKGKKILALGMRYGGLAKKLNSKRDIPGVGISLLIRSTDAGLRKKITKTKKPIASFIQLGTESKLLSLDVIERLRQVKVPLYLSLAKDRLGAQVSSVEKYHTPYVIVMGKKEAVEKTAIVRKTDTYAQEVITLEQLPQYMKKIDTDYWSKNG